MCTHKRNETEEKIKRSIAIKKWKKKLLLFLPKLEENERARGSETDQSFQAALSKYPRNKTTVRKCFNTFQNGWILV